MFFKDETILTHLGEDQGKTLFLSLDESTVLDAKPLHCVPPIFQMSSQGPSSGSNPASIERFLDEPPLKWEGMIHLGMVGSLFLRFGIKVSTGSNPASIESFKFASSLLFLKEKHLRSSITFIRMKLQ
ncbi:hypothetical protein K1719_013622 [Acacia pycnantha]|nr:hypothetical protein K1719_013622 [Acacia pycnantha]